MEWQIILALVIGIPIILFVPALIWVAVASGLSAVIRENIRRRISMRRVRALGVAEGSESRK